MVRREILHNVYEQKQLHYLKYSVAEASSDAAGLSNTLVKRISSEVKQATLQNVAFFYSDRLKQSIRRKRIPVQEKETPSIPQR